MEKLRIMSVFGTRPEEKTKPQKVNEKEKPEKIEKH